MNTCTNAECKNMLSTCWLWLKWIITRERCRLCKHFPILCFSQVLYTSSTLQRCGFHLSSPSSPPISNFQSLGTVQRELHLWQLSLHLFEDHVHSIVFLCWMLVLKVVWNGFQLLPHLQPSLFVKAPQRVQQVVRLGGFFSREKQGKFFVIEVVLVW